MKRIVPILIVLLLSGVYCYGKGGSRRLDRGIVKRTVVPKGQWYFGGSASYSAMDQSNYRFLIMKNWDGSSYNLSVKPFFGYMVKNDLGSGANVSYERSLYKVDNLNISLNDDLTFDIKDYYVLEHVYSGSVVMRLFMNIEDSKRFGLFNDVKLMMGGGQGK